MIIIMMVISVVEADKDDNYVAESEDDSGEVVVFHNVDIEYDSSKEEEWADEPFSGGSDCWYLCWYNYGNE